MIFYLAGLQPLLLYGIIFLVISIFSILCLLFVRKLFRKELDIMRGDLFIVPFFTMNGAVLGFILAMILVETWKNYQAEKDNITIEMANFLGIYRLASGLEPADSAKIKDLTKQLVKEMVEVSWDEHEMGKGGSVTTVRINQLYLLTLNLKVKNEVQNNIRQNLIDSLERATDLRRLRFLRAKQSIIPDPMWPIIIFCIFISIACSCFFSIKPLKLHIIMSLFQAAMLSFVLFLIVSFTFPYRGRMKIEPIQFKMLLDKSFKEIDQTEPF